MRVPFCALYVRFCLWRDIAVDIHLTVLNRTHRSRERRPSLPAVSSAEEFIEAGISKSDDPLGVRTAGPDKSRGILGSGLVVLFELCFRPDRSFSFKEFFMRYFFALQPL